jgi:REP element-mobilizing transposase RayT
MARPLRIQYPGAYYHITCRGNERKKIFLDDQDYQDFLEKLSLSLDIYNVALLAYVCMPNHFHLLATTPEGNLSEFMRHFNISYTSNFNRRYRRVGHLYQGRYRAFLIDADNYLLEVSRYIHLNPIRSQVFTRKSFEEKWDVLLRHKYSSLRGYFTLRKGSEFVDCKDVLGYMGGDNRKGREKYRQFVRWGIEEKIDNPLEIGRGHGVVGEDDFIQWIKGKLSNKGKAEREQPALRELRRENKPEELIEQFAQIIGKEKRELCKRGRKTIERAMLMEVLYRYCKLTQPEIGRLVGGIDYSAVSQARKRLQIRMEREPKLRKRFDILNDQFLQLSIVKI